MAAAMGGGAMTEEDVALVEACMLDGDATGANTSTFVGPPPPLAEHLHMMRGLAGRLSQALEASLDDGGGDTQGLGDLLEVAGPWIGNLRNTLGGLETFWRACEASTECGSPTSTSMTVKRRVRPNSRPSWRTTTGAAPTTTPPPTTSTMTQMAEMTQMTTGTTVTTTTAAKNAMTTPTTPTTLPAKKAAGKTLVPRHSPSRAALCRCPSRSYRDATSRLASSRRGRRRYTTSSTCT
ncbi:hypothetical protein M885DRAFT_527621 [Pelagophyceae sp. CCMP2097]|nr:hypothetical protein M885DRAFT_527621 [Pelagophyceae sp. CCMP2097]